MRKFAFIAAIYGGVGVLLGAFGAHKLKGILSDHHFGAYRVGIEYLFFHLAPLLFLAQQSFTKNLNHIGYCFVFGILFFTSSNVLMTTEAVHHINFHFLWPITPIGGILMALAWIGLAFEFVKNKS